MTQPTLPDLFYTAYFIADGAVHVHEACLAAYDSIDKACLYIDEDRGDLFCIMETKRVHRSGVLLTFDVSDKVANDWLRNCATPEHSGLYIEASDFPKFVQEHADPMLMERIIYEINEHIKSELGVTMGRAI
jgi:hypothetical protein